MTIVLSSLSSKSLATYSALRDALEQWIHRTDLGDRLDDFIALAEAFMFRELDIKTLETSASGTTNGSLIALPSDVASVNRVTVDYAGRAIPLDYNSQPHNYVRSGVPLSYWDESGGLRLDSGGTGYAYTLYYTPSIQALSDANPTNWLLSNAPDLYLSTSQLEAAKFVQDDRIIALMQGAIPPLLDSVQRFTKRVGQPNRGGMQIKPR